MKSKQIAVMPDDKARDAVLQWVSDWLKDPNRPAVLEIHEIPMKSPTGQEATQFSLQVRANVAAVISMTESSVILPATQVPTVALNALHSNGR